jgi:tight adherence protein B
MIWWLAASVLALAGACAIIAVSFQHARHALDDDAPQARRQRAREVPRAAADYFARAGITIAPEQVWLVLAFTSIGCALCLAWLPPRYGFAAVAAVLLGVHLTIGALGARLRRRTLAQLPSFLNQVIRRVAAGASVELAINDSLVSINQPLSGILERAGRRVRLGYELHDSLEREAVITGLPEFHMLATVLRLNEQFGGSIRGVLENIVDILLVRQQGQRELKALTGETRITAVVLAALPVAAAGYMLLLNPTFFLDMWKDPFGHQLLVTAGAMQVLGVIVLWRMVRSV